MRGGSWDSFGLFLVLARDLWHCTSAQLSCSLFVLFCIVSFPMVIFLRVQIGMTLFQLMCLGFLPTFFEISLFGVVYVFTVLFFCVNHFPGVSCHCIGRGLRFHTFLGHFSKVVLSWFSYLTLHTF